MNILLIILIILLSTVFFSVIMLGVSYTTHKSQVKSFTRSYKPTTFKGFLKEFDKVDWEYSENFPSSLFEVGRHRKFISSQIHASVIEIEGRGMYMKNIIEYIKFGLRIKERKIILDRDQRKIINRDKSLESLIKN